MTDIKTLIELFDDCQIKNVASGLRYTPEKIIFVCFNDANLKKKRTDSAKFLKAKIPDVKIEYEFVDRFDFDNITEKLMLIVDNNPDCCFDLTGGKELVLAAMGVVSQTRNVPMIQCDIKKGTVINVKNAENLLKMPIPKIMLDEMVELNGGKIVRDEVGFLSDVNKVDFEDDIERMWSICKKDCSFWNKQVKLFSILENIGYINQDLYVNVNLQEGTEITLPDCSFVNLLQESGLLKKYKCEDNKISFQYKNRLVYKCINKAGNILELFTYMILHKIKKEIPGYYDDIDMGVLLDWDGVLHKKYENVKDTNNEIDVMVTRRMFPIFISCKNGDVKKEALYELDTVAKKFGGEYSKKILLTSYLSSNAESKKYLLQRAIDMDIKIIEGIDKLNTKEFYNVIKETVK